MTRDDAPEFVARLSAARMAFDRPVDDAITQVYFKALADRSLEDVLAALDEAMKSCERFPTPPQLRANITAIGRRRMLEKSTREALSEEPGEPIALPAGHGPLAMGPAKPVKRIKLTGTDPTPVAVVAERQRRASETWDESMARLRRQREALGLTDADVAAAKQEAS